MTAFTLEEAQAASDSWGFNCGPGAACAVLGTTPDAIRQHLGDFESKGYTNPTLMASIIRNAGATFLRKYECAHLVEGRPTKGEWPNYGVVRIQWGGPWTRDGVPMRVRYRHTHWVASRSQPPTGWRATRPMPMPHWPGHEIFDINAMSVGGWLSFDEWANELTPWLIRQCQPKADGTWWPTHCWEVSNTGR